VYLEADTRIGEIAMKKAINALLMFVLVAVGQFLIGQDTSSTQSTAPSSQTTHSKSASHDGDLTQQLQTKFSQDPAFANVLVSVTKATALITGSVPAKADKKRAKELAKSISGVKHVKDELTINPSAGKSTKDDNKPTDASLNSPASNNAATAASNSANPPNGEPSATSNNPNSQASSPTGASGTAASVASPGAGENASSAPQSTGNAASENNMAGQGSTANQTPSAAPNTSGASANPPSASQPMVGSGAIGANAGGSTSPSPANAAGNADLGASVNDTATLQGQIQNALQNEPTLRNDNVNVTVTDSTIELSGTVQNGKEKETARRIASSFAGNRRVKDRVTLSGKGAASTNPGSSNLGSNPAANPLNPNPNTQNPSANNPAANGDASTNPR
jgi:osmotically-inducible protein OsmY